MKIILMIVSLALLSLLIVKVANIYLDRQDHAMTTTQELMQQDSNLRENTNPVQFSTDKINEINQKTQERSNEINNLQ